MVPAVLFLPWVFAVIAVARWYKHATPGAPMSGPARIGVAVGLVCIAIAFSVAANVFGSVVWFILGALLWGSASIILFRTLSR